MTPSAASVRGKCCLTIGIGFGVTSILPGHSARTQHLTYVYLPSFKTSTQHVGPMQCHGVEKLHNTTQLSSHKPMSGNQHGAMCIVLTVVANQMTLAKSTIRVAVQCHFHPAEILPGVLPVPFVAW